MELAVSVIVWILCGIWGSIIGSNKNRPVLGAFLGFAMGLIGIVVIACLEKKKSIGD